MITHNTMITVIQENTNAIIQTNATTPNEKIIKNKTQKHNYPTQKPSPCTLCFCLIPVPLGLKHPHRTARVC